MARKVGQIIARGDRRWLIRVYLGRDHETQKRNYLGHQFGQDFVLGLDLLLQELDPLLLLLDLTRGTFLRLEGSRSVLEELLLPAIEHGGLQPISLTQIGNWDLV
jgi:hypothetical protein